MSAPFKIKKSNLFVIKGGLLSPLSLYPLFCYVGNLLKSPRLIAQVASRFGFVVTQKAAAQTIPVIGALGGAPVNYAFIDHFQSVARGHFTVRRLERKYGKDIIFAAYEQLRQTLDSSQ